MIAIDTNVLLRYLIKPVDGNNPKWQVDAAEAQEALATKRDIDDLRRDIESKFTQMEQRIIIKLGALMTLSIGIVATLVKQL